MPIIKFSANEQERKHPRKAARQGLARLPQPG